MMNRDYNSGDYGSLPEPPRQPEGFGSFDNYQQNPGMMGQPNTPGYRGVEQSNYGQQASFYNRPTSIPGTPAQSTPAIPSLSEEDVAIFRETQKDIMFKKFFPAAVIGCGAIFMAHQKKIIKPSAWTYGIYLCAASYVTQFTARNELKRRVAESSSMSPFAQQVRMQLGYVNKQRDGSFGEFSDPTFATATGSFSTSTTPHYSPYNRYHRQKQSNTNEFVDEFDSADKDLTEFTADPKDVSNNMNTEFAPDDILAGDTGFRTRRVVDQADKPEKSRLTYEELRMRNRAQYSSSPSPSNMQPAQPMHSNQPDMYNNVNNRGVGSF